MAGTGPGGAAAPSPPTSPSATAAWSSDLEWRSAQAELIVALRGRIAEQDELLARLMGSGPSYRGPPGVWGEEATAVQERAEDEIRRIHEHYRKQLGSFDWAARNQCEEASKMTLRVAAQRLRLPAYAQLCIRSWQKLVFAQRLRIQHVSALAFSQRKPALMRSFVAWRAFCAQVRLEWRIHNLEMEVEDTFGVARTEVKRMVNFSLERTGWLLRIQGERLQLTRGMCAWSKAMVQARMQYRVTELCDEVDKWRRLYNYGVSAQRDRAAFLIARMLREPLVSTYTRFFRIWKQALQLTGERWQAEVAAAQSREVNEHLTRLDRLHQLSLMNGNPAPRPMSPTSATSPSYAAPWTANLSSPRAGSPPLVTASEWPWPAVGHARLPAPPPTLDDGIKSSAMLWTKLEDLEGYMEGVQQRLDDGLGDDYSGRFGTAGTGAARYGPSSRGNFIDARIGAPRAGASRSLGPQYHPRPERPGQTGINALLSSIR